MDRKVIDIDPSKRISKEAFEQLQESIARLTYDDVDSITFIGVGRDGKRSIYAYGFDYNSLGLTQAVLSALAHELLATEYASNDA